MSHLPGSMDLVRQRTYAGMGQHFATLDQALPGVSDEHVHIDAPVFGVRHSRTWPSPRASSSAPRRAASAAPRPQWSGAQPHGRLTARCRTWQQHLAIARTARAHLVGVQTLSLKGMARRKKGCRFARSVADDGYGQLVQVLTRQADKRGRAVVQADRFYPWSKTCSDCGAVKTKLPLSEREYTGTTCGLSLDRDVNAVPNLAALARTLRPGAPPGQAVRSLLAA